MMPSITEHCPPKIYIGTKRRFQQGPVWCYELAKVGSSPRLIYVCKSPPETTHGSNDDVMFICEEQGGYFVAYEGKVVNTPDSQALVQRGAATEAFWEAGDHRWEINSIPTRASYDAPWENPNWESSGWKVRTQHGL